MNTNVAIGVASIPDRERNLRQVVDDLYDDCVCFFIHLNGYKVIPKWLKSGKYSEKCNVSHRPDLGDSGKFKGVHLWPGYYLCVDDDLYYPGNYVSRTVDAIRRYDNRWVVSYHGKTFRKFPIDTYFRGDMSPLRCLGSVDKDTVVPIIGSGVLGFHTDIIPDNFRLESVFGNGYMADVWFSSYCNMNNIPRVVLAHEAGWITHQKINMNATLFVKYRNNDGEQVRVINSSGPWE